MDEKVDPVEVLTHRVEELQRERDELKKDIEQLCMQQAGPGYISVATRMLSQRTAALEQDIENLQKKLGGCLRENQNLQEELAEAYRVKSQLAELHGAELSKASLEREKDLFKDKIAKLQSNLRMGLEIEQHLQRNARILEKRQALYDDFIRSGLLELQKFHEYQRTEIIKMLEEGSSHLSTVVAEIQEKLSTICVSTEISENPVDILQCASSCKDVHVSNDIVSDTGTSPKDDSPTVCNSVTSDESKALAQALQEKMEVLMLFSQEQERYLLDKQRNQIIIEDLQKNLSQVKDEKVKALMELAKLKEECLLLKGSSAMKEGNGIGDSLKVIPGHDQHGMLRNMLKRTSLSHWMRKDSSNIGYGSSGENDHAVCKEHSVDIARLKVENAALMESVGTVERLTSSVHRLHVVLLKAHDDVKLAGSLESTYEALNSLITEANLMKTALGAVLPVSWSGDSSDATTYEALYDSSDSTKSKSEKVDPLSSAGMEMVELLILAAEILKESFLLNK